MPLGSPATEEDGICDLRHGAHKNALVMTYTDLLANIVMTGDTEILPFCFTKLSSDR